MEKINTRVYEEANYLVNNKSTIREVAKVFKVSKSTVHNDLVIRLKETNRGLFLKVKDVLLYNTKMRHIRGGEATKKKYSKENKKSIN
jgi:putative DeoR family transcriptional regulator (stage III sporulation protein D)